MKGPGGSITSESLRWPFPGSLRNRCLSWGGGSVCLHPVGPGLYAFCHSSTRHGGTTPARAAGVHRLGPLNRMLPSRVGSAPPPAAAAPGNGSSAARGATVAHSSGLVSGGIRPVLVRAGQLVTGLGDSTAGRQGDRESVGMLGANGPGGSRGVRPGNGATVTTLQTAVQGGMMGLNTGVVLTHAGRFDAERESAPLCSGSDNDSDSGDDDDPMGSLGDGRRGVKREREMEAAVTGQEVGVAPGSYGIVPGGVAGAKPGKKTRGRVKIKMEFIDNKLRRYTTFSKRKTGIMKKVSHMCTFTKEIIGSTWVLTGSDPLQ